MLRSGIAIIGRKAARSSDPEVTRSLILVLTFRTPRKQKIFHEKKCIRHALLRSRRDDYCSVSRTRCPKPLYGQLSAVNLKWPEATELQWRKNSLSPAVVGHKQAAKLDTGACR